MHNWSLNIEYLIFENQHTMVTATVMESSTLLIASPTKKKKKRKQDNLWLDGTNMIFFYLMYFLVQCNESIVDCAM